MINIIRVPDRFKIHYDNSAYVQEDGVVRFVGVDGKLKVFLTATRSKPMFIELRWAGKTEEKVSIFGDKWERAYGDLQWTRVRAESFMPWYFFARGPKGILACGVETQPSSLVCWSFDKEGISCWLDVRCGGSGVELGGRELEAATIISKVFRGVSAFEAAKRFCKMMCPAPLLPVSPVYGGNNWQYSHGESSYIDIINDTKLQAQLSEGLENRPFMVIDDGWQKTRRTGPWEPNEKFLDMEQLASDIKSLGVRPGIWVRFLATTSSEVPEKFKINRPVFDGDSKNGILDPSHPKVLQYVARETRKLVSWGYELIKHDRSTTDIFACCGRDCNGKITKDGWTFYDRAKTSAEIVKNFYRTIYENAGDAVILGCNCIPHLAAGFVHLNRIGADTSAVSWAQTRKHGINALAFRLPQNKAFYMADADCVGILDNKIKWKYTGALLELISKSGSPLFISCSHGTLNDAQTEEIKKAFARASRQEDTLTPLDWEETSTPNRWLVNGEEELNFEWYGNGAVIE